jgi:hypothetical protein
MRRASRPARHPGVRHADGDRQHDAEVDAAGQHVAGGEAEDGERRHAQHRAQPEQAEDAQLEVIAKAGEHASPWQPPHGRAGRTIAQKPPRVDARIGSGCVTQCVAVQRSA